MLVKRGFCFRPDGEGGGGAKGDEGKGAGGSSDGDTKGDGDQGDGDGGSGDQDDPKWDASTKSLISNLRKENAERRKKNKALETEFGALKSQFATMQKGMKKALGVEDDNEMTPEETIEALRGAHGQAELRTAILETAIEHGISKENFSYYEFLISKKLESLGEDEELSDEALAEVVAEVNARGAGGGKGNGGSSVGGGGANGNGNQPGGKGNGAPTLEQFVKMTVSEKSQL